MVNVIVSCYSTTMRQLYYSILMMVLFSSPTNLEALSGKSKGRPLPNSSNEVLISNPYLPEDLQPQQYDLEIFTEFEDGTAIFWGTVLIKVKCLKSTDKIILHQRKLNIFKNRIKVKLSESDPPSFIRIKDYASSSIHDLYVIILRKALEKDKNYEIKIEYSRTRDIHGPEHDKGYLFEVYRRTDSILSPGNQISYTVMSDVGARRVFPCFDQLGMKATFKIKHTHRRNVKAISNANKISTKPMWNPFLYVKDEFKETVPMEAKSVAIALLETDFLSEIRTYTQSSSLSKTDIRIFADPKVFKELKYILELATRIFQFFSDYFEVSYPFTKLDIIAVPEFSTRAVASYGVIYISEKALLNGFGPTSTSVTYEAVSEMCHTISRQWLGHTVTVLHLKDDWIHIVLNILLQTQCAIEVEPNWKLNFIEPAIVNSYFDLFELIKIESYYESFLVMGQAPIYLQDFSSIKLKKSYHLIRMIHFVLGQDIFKKGINDYVERFKFSNSKHDDLWTTFTNTANRIKPDLLPNISVGEIMTSWGSQKGYPLITVTWKRETKEISISQSQFNASEKRSRCWLIPLSYTTKTESKVKINNSVRQWLTCGGDLNLNIEMHEDDWFLLDLKVNVIGRVNYDKSIWIAIQKSLVNNEEPEVFDAFTRARLTSDMFVFAELGALPYTIVLDAMKYLSREDHNVNWTIALREFNKIRSLLIQSRVHKPFKKCVQGLLEPVFQRKKYRNLFENTSADSTLTSFIESSCNYGIKACRQKSLELIRKWKEGDTKLDSLPVILQQTIHCQGIKYGNRKHWDFLWNLYIQGPKLYSPESISILESLGCSTSVRILKRFLKWSIDDKKVSLGDSVTIFHSVSSNKKGYKLTRKFFMKNFDRITEFAGKPELVKPYWEVLFNTTVDGEDLYQLLEFAKSRVHTVKSTTFMSGSRNTAERNVAWLRNNKKVLENYFQNSTPRKYWIFS